MKRGAAVPGTNGRYVGTDKAGTKWVAYPQDNFRKMCRLFDKTNK